MLGGVATPVAAAVVGANLAVAVVEANLAVAAVARAEVAEVVKRVLAVLEGHLVQAGGGLEPLVWAAPLFFQPPAKR